jgi:hypothetical protein
MKYMVEAAHRAIPGQDEFVEVDVTVRENGSPKDGLNVTWVAVDVSKYSGSSAHNRFENLRVIEDGQGLLHNTQSSAGVGQGSGVYTLSVRRDSTKVWFPGHTLLRVEVRDSAMGSLEGEGEACICWGLVHLTDHFCIHYSAATGGSPSQQLLPPSGGTSQDVAEQIGEDLETAWASLGEWRAPDDFAPLRSCHGAGITAGDNSVNFSDRICVVCWKVDDNVCRYWRYELASGHADLRKADSMLLLRTARADESSWLADASNRRFLRETTAHELFHIVQGRYNAPQWNVDRWWWEGPAQWYVSMVYPGASQAAIHGEENSAWGARPNLSLDDNNPGFVYGRAVFFRFVMEKVGLPPRPETHT